MKHPSRGFRIQSHLRAGHPLADYCTQEEYDQYMNECMTANHGSPFAAATCAINATMRCIVKGMTNGNA